MPSGEAPCGARERGATYLLLMGLLALMAAAMAALGEQWAQQAQREREAELVFRGNEFSQALARWREATPAGQPGAPLQLEDLLVDTRMQPPRHHLRRLYVDPFTGRPDWALLRNAEGRITGVLSRSRQPALRRVRVKLNAGADDRKPTVGDWLFEAAPPLDTTVARKKSPP